MHPILSNRARVGLYLAAWLPLAGLLASLLVLQAPLSWLHSAALAVPLTLLYAFICLPAWYICRVFPVDTTSQGRLLVMQLLAALFSALLWAALGFVWARLLVHLSGQDLFSEVYTATVPLFLGMGTVIFVAVAFVHYLLIAWQETAEADKRALELAVLAREAELKALKMQLAPHFLFNSLNSISALSGSSPKAAREMCLLLASFLRKSLTFGARAHITLAEELSLVADFLAIEQVRFGPRLKIKKDIAEDVRNCRLPPLLLQPLLENAVNHGISDLLDGGTIHILAERAGGRALIRISNPFDPDGTRRHGTGLGIENVRRRLETAFGEEGRLDVRRDSEVFEVILTFPLQTRQEESTFHALEAR